jgi:maltooligosyltrehalose trehalohydrolase
MYFIEHGDPALVEAVREGRKKEFEEIGKSELQVDPQAEATFARCRLDWAKRDTAPGGAMLRLYSDLLALRREEPALRPGASETHVEGGAEWFTALRVMPLQNDLYDHVRSRRALLCVFNTSGHPQQIPIRPDAIGEWRLRLSTDAEGYGGAGMLVESIPAPEPDPDVNDAPKRLLAPAAPVEQRLRTVRLPAWSAAVYVRDFTTIDVDVSR